VEKVMLLPKVTKETGSVILQDIEYPGYINSLFKQIKIENPVVAGMILGMCSQYLDKESTQQTEKPVMPVEAAISMAALVYKHLESQAEIDVLKKQLML
jgi:hypothetical protein